MLQRRWQISNMASRLERVWDRLQGSYWFVPSIMALLAAFLSFIAIGLDVWLGDDWAQEINWFFQNKAEGARTLLATVAGSMIGVAGVTFSITIMAVVQAAQQFGPRLIINFMRDRGNQVVLGTYIATFVYCLMVLRTVQDSTDTAEAFVPHLSVVIGLVLTLGSLGVLIYFVHHVPEMMNVSTLVARLGDDLAHHIQVLQKQAETDAPVGTELPGPHITGEPHPIRARHAGYVEHMDEKALISLATAHGLTLLLECMPGQFVRQGEALALAWPASHVDDNLATDLQGAFSVASQRSPSQDVLFFADELVEVAARALSPSTNDPYTAIGCMNWIGNALAIAAGSSFPAPVRADDEGAPRLYVQGFGFADLLARTLGRLRFYVQGDRTAALHFLGVLASLAKELKTDEQRFAVARLARELRVGAKTSLTHPDDAKIIELCHQDLEARLAGEGSARFPTATAVPL